MELLLSWLTPSGLMILLGGIVWGVQLNINAMMQAKRLARLEARQDEYEQTMALISKDLVRVGLILDNLEKDIEKAVDHVEEHDKEAESWKQRIVRLEERYKDK